eukprot:GHVR01184305.1.p1 GENE.GHVR01184305.1~~GHVR01184305.1.p1  ORF type:complete len:146 (-),score=44.67 GHVR01184305.1:191-628(-)
MCVSRSYINPLICSSVSAPLLLTIHLSNFSLTALIFLYFSSLGCFNILKNIVDSADRESEHVSDVIISFIHLSIWSYKPDVFICLFIFMCVCVCVYGNDAPLIGCVCGGVCVCMSVCVCAFSKPFSLSLSVCVCVCVCVCLYAFE